MPLYEYRCLKCGAISSYIEKLDAFHLFRVKCKSCRSRKTERVLSTFTASASRSQADMLNDMKSMGNVTFTQSPGPAPMPISEDGVCPSCGNAQPSAEE